MEPLVHSKETEEVRGGGVGRSASPAFPKGSAEIVSFGQHSPFPDVKTLAEGIKVEESACKLQIGIRDGTMWVVSRHQPRGDKIWPLVPPYKRLCGSEASAGGKVWTGKPNPARTQSQSIMVPFCNWRERHNLRNPSGAGADVFLHPPEVLKGVVNTLVKFQAPTCLQGKRILHGAEDVARSWKCKGH
jgi:hypothetical protein